MHYKVPGLLIFSRTVITINSKFTEEKKTCVFFLYYKSGGVNSRLSDPLILEPWLYCHSCRTIKSVIPDEVSTDIQALTERMGLPFHSYEVSVLSSDCLTDHMYTLCSRRGQKCLSLSTSIMPKP